MPTKNIAKAAVMPGIAPANPYLYPASAVYMHVMTPNSVAASEAMPK